MEGSSSLHVTPPCQSGHGYCGRGDKMLLIYHMTSRDHVLKGLCDLVVDGSSSKSLLCQV